MADTLKDKFMTKSIRGSLKCQPPKDWILVEDALEIVKQQQALLIEALEFYADPETYFAIGFFPDPPCGAFVDDFEYLEDNIKPGKKARDTLKLVEED